MEKQNIAPFIFTSALDWSGELGASVALLLWTLVRCQLNMGLGDFRCRSG